MENDMQLGNANALARLEQVATINLLLRTQAIAAVSIPAYLKGEKKIETEVQARCRRLNYSLGSIASAGIVYGHDKVEEA